MARDQSLMCRIIYNLIHIACTYIISKKEELSLGSSVRLSEKQKEKTGSDSILEPFNL